MMNGWKRLNPTLLLLIGLAAICLTACEKRLQTITVTEMMTPPESLLEPCERPEASRMETNDDLIRFASISVLKWEQCAARINALRVFFGLDKENNDLLETAPANEPH